MAGFWAAIHLLRLVSDLARQISRWVSRRTLQALRVKSKRLLAKAMVARNKHSARRNRRARRLSGSDSERLRQDDGFRRD